MKLPILISFAYWEEEHRAFVEEHKDQLKVLVDSGAFTAWRGGDPVELDDYLDFIDENEHLIDEHIQLDVIGDPEGTTKNLQISRERGYDPLPVFTIGHTKKYLKEISGDRFCCGCVKPGQDNDATVDWVLRNSVDPSKCHILGTSLVKYFRHKTPPQSIDASSWLSPLRFGHCDFPLSAYRSVNVDRQFIRNTKTPEFKKVNRMCKKHGLHLEELRDPGAWKNRVDSPLRLLVLIAGLYRVKMVKESYGKDYVLAVALKSDIEMLQYAFDIGLVDQILN